MYQLLRGAVTPAQWMSLQNSHWHHNTDNLNAAFTFLCVKGLTKCVCLCIPAVSHHCYLLAQFLPFSKNTI